jgi:protoheme IX farnesyltransferase
MATNILIQQTSCRCQQYLALCKLRVVSLIVFTAIIGMFLATPGMVPWRILLAGTAGIGLVAAAAAAFNCLVEQKIDALMARTRARPLPRGELSSGHVILLSGLIGGIGLYLLNMYVNGLTMWLTLLTFLGYAVIYTVILKPLTPQNIVIGGASGAMPPILGWAAVNGTVGHDALLLFLIIFAWTPPHFWSLALYRKQEYARAGLPMLPVTHGDRYTRLHVLLYTLILFAVSLLPVATGMGKLIYALGAVVLGARFIQYGWLLWRQYSDALARRCFKFSIVYLSLLFALLLVDHYWPIGFPFIKLIY